MRTGLLLAVLLGAIVGGGCSSDDSSSGGSSDAITKCDTLIDHFCSFVDGCKIEDKASCVNEAMSALDCSKAVGVTASYDQCVTDVKALTCPADNQPALPASCKGTVLLSSSSSSSPPGTDSDAVAKCDALLDDYCVFVDGCKIEDKASCAKEVAGAIDCSRATTIASTYGQCVNDVKTMSCPANNQPQLPPSCSGVIGVKTASGSPGDGLQSVAPVVATLSAR